MKNKYDFDYFEDIDGLEDISIDDNLYEDLLDNFEKNNKKIDYKKEIQNIYEDLIKYEKSDKEELSKLSGENETLYDKELDDINYEIEKINIENDLNKKKSKFKIFVPIIICFCITFIIAIFNYFNKDKSFTIKFDTNGGSNIANQVVNGKNKLSIPSDPIKSGYTFDGWYLDDNLFDFNSIIKSNITLTAHWKEDITDIQNIKFEQEQITMKVADTKKLVLIIEPDNISNDIIWTSSDDRVVIVNNEGYVTAKEKGSVTITAKTIDGRLSANCIINVSDNIIKVDSMILNKNDFILNVGDEYHLYPVITPNNASDKGLIWESSNNKVATVINGKIKALNYGTTIISATTVDGNIKDSLLLTVKNSNIKNNTTSNVQKVIYSLKINNKNIELEEGQTSIIDLEVEPKNDKLFWTSSDTNIVSVDNGKISAKAPGKVIITVKNSNGDSDTCNIIVSEKLNLVEEDKYSIIISPINDDNDEIKYIISATKNDAIINDYKVVYNGNNYEPNSIVDDIDTNITSTSIYINDELVYAQVIYKK